MKKILIPTDFSEHAEYALKVAAQIARKNNGEIILLHMLELPHEGSDAISKGHDIPELMFFKNAAINKLEEIMDSPYLDGINVSEVIQFEMAFEGILNISRLNNVDLIVMGSHGASGYKEMFIGSNAEKVVRNAEVPVLIIKKDMGEFNVDKFVFASDFYDETRQPFTKAVEFANKFGATLHLVMINTPNNFKSTSTAQGIIDGFVRNFQINNYVTHIYNETNVEKGILNFANSIDADLIGMSTHGRKGLAHFFNGSISEDLVNHAQRPVVTFKI
ncbi:universal stress protein [Flavobacterium sp.]|jgi:nucleotide-binding universal stress UspA family protein|uniref:universal stress protein n=1 Tax=Flavobacterium sp. TaxID=239 RepID=UPI0022C14325|nr:universal stress protein [Flavobacterium sp.]MCZ8144369.1 universal stress protein [Flavobacterium sp.]MCZ8367708.1 universal stress protein [Flavobacterium sp.]